MGTTKAKTSKKQKSEPEKQRQRMRTGKNKKKAWNSHLEKNPNDKQNKKILLEKLTKDILRCQE